MFCLEIAIHPDIHGGLLEQKRPERFSRGGGGGGGGARALYTGRHAYVYVFAVFHLKCSACFPTYRHINRQSHRECGAALVWRSSSSSFSESEDSVDLVDLETALRVL